MVAAHKDKGVGRAKVGDLVKTSGLLSLNVEALSSLSAQSRWQGGQTRAWSGRDLILTS